jgi:hypothetical protein
MTNENIKKSFYVTPELAKEWEKFHEPSKDFSPSAAAGMLLYLTADQPGLREAMRKLATYKDIKKAIIEAKSVMVRSVLEAEALKAISQNRDNSELLSYLSELKAR